jgi:hypothetical protein
MKPWTAFYDWVNPEVPGVPAELVSMHARSIAIDFFDTAGIYVADSDPVVLTANVATYDLDAPANYDVARIQTLWYNGVELTPKGEQDFKALFGQWTTQTGNPTFFLQETQADFRLVPCPDATAVATCSTVNMRVVLRPSRGSAGIEDWIFDKWVETMAYGIKWRLMAMPAKPFSNPQLATYNQGLYRAGTDDAIRDVSRGLTRAQIRIRPPTIM